MKTNTLILSLFVSGSLMFAPIVKAEGTDKTAPVEKAAPAAKGEKKHKHCDCPDCKKGKKCTKKKCAHCHDDDAKEDTTDAAKKQ